ncbi:hypothetical protein IQ07DRAFT_521772 [Pyrenochaeta sp. DS3sAY3a]|nr:hypothetical protein IQ07DRAFT_521772 [Pyrenochaeta sp. DS3sAY3a]
MTVSLDQLPFDVLFLIASRLSSDDYIHLASTCHHLRALLEEKSLCRQAVEAHYRYTKEARLAQTRKITYKEALESIHDRRHAFANAYPFSARNLGTGNSFLHHQGNICILEGETVRISDVYGRFDGIHINLLDVLQHALKLDGLTLDEYSIKLLYYGDNILSIHAISRSSPDGNYIIAIQTTADVSLERRIITVIQLGSSTKLFVRHNSHCLYYGTHTGLGDDGHRKWVIEGRSLRADFELPERRKPILLENFHGADIGSTVAFEIHNDHFYAVSNQGTFEVEEIDYTSFYHWIRFPTDQPIPTAIEKNERLYRRQHKQGPIHDSWTDLSLQIDEFTNETVIVEARREWAQASSRQSRTFYVTKLENTDQFSSCILPDDDVYIPLIDETNRPNYMPTPPQFSWSQHPEFSSDEVSPRAFPLTKTKFRAYNYPCAAFLDLVEDDKCCNDPSKPPCLRIRMGSRRALPLESALPPSKGKGKSSDQSSEEPSSKFADNATYRHSPIRLWPPPASRCPCSRRLHDILNPSLPGGSIHGRRIVGAMDECTLVFMIKPSRSYGRSDDGVAGTIVAVNFSRPLLPQDPDADVQGAVGGEAHVEANSPCMERRDSKMDDEVNTSSWEWELGLERKCRTGTCQ